MESGSSMIMSVAGKTELKHDELYQSKISSQTRSCSVVGCWISFRYVIKRYIQHRLPAIVPAACNFTRGGANVWWSKEVWFLEENKLIWYFMDHVSNSPDMASWEHHFFRSLVASFPRKVFTDEYQIRAEFFYFYLFIFPVQSSDTSRWWYIWAYHWFIDL